MSEEGILNPGGGDAGNYGADAGANANAGAGDNGNNGDAGNSSTISGGDSGTDNAPWYGEIEDSELKGWVENKGFKDPATALQSMRNMEKLVGGDKIAVPKDDSPEEWAKVYNKLGRPEKAEDYQIPVPEEIGDKEFAGEAAKTMHELGLNTKQARGIAEWYNQQTQAMQEKMQVEMDEAAKADAEALRKEWGGNYATEVETANRVMRQYDITSEEQAAILSGSEAALAKMLNRIGKSFGEDSFKEGQGSGQFTQTSDGAKAEIEALKSDKDFMKKYFSGDKTAKAKMDSLYKRATAG